MKKRKFMVSLLALTSLVGASVTVQAGKVAVKKGDKIAFLGDSITQQGARKANGYVNLVMRGLEAVNLKSVAIHAGISGHKSNQMLARLEKHVLSKKPDLMTLSCGVNDVWHRKRGVNLEDYKKNITEIVKRCQDAKIKVMILTSTMIKENPDNDLNGKLVKYNKFLKKLASEKDCLFADLNGDMQAMVKAAKDKKGGKLLTYDGVHMNNDGNEMMAAGVLKALGLNDSQIKKARASWGAKK